MKYYIQDTRLAEEKILTDRKGKEICQGDIVKFQYSDEMQTLDVEGEELEYPEYTEGCQTSVVGRKGIIQGDFYEYNTTLIEWAMDNDYVFEVIGNIHQTLGQLNKIGWTIPQTIEDVFIAEKELNKNPVPLPESLKDPLEILRKSQEL